MRRLDLTPLLLLLPLLFALLPEGLPNTADMPVHFIRAAEMVHAWQDGIFLPRWSENLGYGYGIPLFNYAPPLPYLLTALLHTLGIPLEIALKGTLLLALMVAAWGSYRLIGSSFGTVAGAVGSVAFLYAPYRLRELFIQGNVGQLLAWSFIPWAMWGVAQLWSTGKARYGIVVAVAVAGALLSHNVVALMLAVLLVCQTLGMATLHVLNRYRRRGRTAPPENRFRWFLMVAKVAFAGMGGVALAAWFSLPALLEGDFIQLDKIVASDYRTRFVPLSELLALSPPLDRAAVNPYLPLTLGAVQVGMGVGGLVGLVAWMRERGEGRAGRRTQDAETTTETSPPVPLSVTERGGTETHPLAPFQAGGTATHPLAPSQEGGLETHTLAPASASRVLRPAFWGYGLLAVGGAAMAHQLSLPLWERLPFVELFEFPARWHGFTAVGLAGLAGAAVAAIESRHEKGAVWAGGIAIVVLLLSSLVNLYPQRLPLGTLKNSPADVVQFELSTGAVGTTSLAEFNPVWRTIPLTTSPLIEEYRAQQLPQRIDPRSLPPSTVAETVESQTESHHLRITLTAPATITLNLLYFPGWTARVNGISTPLSPEAETGLAQLALPVGTHDLLLHLEDTPLRQWSEWLSLATWGALGGWIILKAIRYRPALPQLAVGVAGQWVLIPLVPIVVLYFAFPTIFAPTSPPDSAEPAHTLLRADWGDQLRLLGADLPDEVLPAGRTVTVVAYVRALRPLDTDYALYLHLDDPMGQTIATSDQRHPAEIPTSNLPPSLYVRIPFQFTLPADLPPMQYQWRLGWYDPARDTPLPLADGQKDALLGPLWVDAPTPPRPQGARATFGEGIALRGVVLNREANQITLFWENTAPVTEDVTIFVHLLDATGQMVGQADGDPFGNRYPLSAWRHGQIFTETRSLSADTDYTTVAIGIYRRADGSRLPAVAGNGERLPNDAVLIRE